MSDAAWTTIGVIVAGILSATSLVIVEIIRRQFRPNHGSTLKDQVDRIEKRQVEQHEQGMSVNSRQDAQIERLFRSAHEFARQSARDAAETRSLIRRYHPDPN